MYTHIHSHVGVYVCNLTIIIVPKQRCWNPKVVCVPKKKKHGWGCETQTVENVEEVCFSLSLSLSFSFAPPVSVSTDHYVSLCLICYCVHIRACLCRCVSVCVRVCVCLMHLSVCVSAAVCAHIPDKSPQMSNGLWLFSTECDMTQHVVEPP